MIDIKILFGSELFRRPFLFLNNVHLTHLKHFFISILFVLAFLSPMFLFGCQPDTPNKESLAWLEQAKLAKNFDQKIYLFSKSISADGRNYEAFARRGYAYLITGSTGWDPLGGRKIYARKRALADINKAIELNPNYALVYAYRGLAYSETNNFDDAKIDFEHAIKIAPRNPELYLMKARFFYQYAKYDQGLKEASSALSINPELAHAFLARSRCYSQLGKYRESLVEIQKALNVTLDSSELYIARSFIYKRQNDFDKAVTDVNSAIELDSNNYRYYKLRSDLYLALHLKDKAEQDLVTSNELNPDYHFQRSLFSDPEEGIGYISKAIELNPWNSSYYAMRGRLFSAIYEHDKALTDFNRALELNSENRSAYSYRGNHYSTVSELELALGDYKKACDLGDCEAYEKALMEKRRPDDEKFWDQVFQGVYKAADILKRYDDEKPFWWEEQYVRDKLSRINYAFYHGDKASIDIRDICQTLVAVFDDDTYIPSEIAAYQKVPEKLLAQLAKSESEKTLSGVAKNLNTPIDILTSLSLSESKMILMNLADNASLPDDILVSLVKYSDIEVARKVRLNVNVTRDDATQEKMNIVKEIYALRAPLSENWRYRNEGEGKNLSKYVHVTERTLSALAQDAREYIRLWIVRHPGTPSNILADLSNDSSVTVLYWILLHERSSDRVKKMIVDSLGKGGSVLTLEDVYLAIAADGEIEMRLALTMIQDVPESVLELLSDDSEEDVRKRVVQNPKVTNELIRKLSLDSSNNVRYSIARFRGTPPEILSKLSLENDKMRTVIADNVNAPVHLLKSLRKSSEEEIAKKAQSTLQNLEKIEKLRERKRESLYLVSSRGRAHGGLSKEERINYVKALLQEVAAEFRILQKDDPFYEHRRGNKSLQKESQYRFNTFWLPAYNELISLIEHKKFTLREVNSLADSVFHELIYLRYVDPETLVEIEDLKMNFFRNQWFLALDLDNRLDEQPPTSEQYSWLRILVDNCYRNIDQKVTQKNVDFMLEVLENLPVKGALLSGDIANRLYDGSRYMNLYEANIYYGFLAKLSESKLLLNRIYSRFGMIKIQWKKGDNIDASFLSEIRSLKNLILKGEFRCYGDVEKSNLYNNLKLIEFNVKKKLS